MSTELIINASLPETRIALMENGEIQDLLIERASGKGIVGNIYKGRVTRVLPGMQAAFVDIGLEKAAFLYVDDVFVHSEIWEAEEGPVEAEMPPASGAAEGSILGAVAGEAMASAEEVSGNAAPPQTDPAQALPAEAAPTVAVEVDDAEVAQWEDEVGGEDDDLGEGDEDEDEGDEDDDQGPVGMCPPPGEGEGEGPPSGTVGPESGGGSSEEGASQQGQAGGQGGGNGDGARRKRHRRGRRGGKFRKRDGEGGPQVQPLQAGQHGVSGEGAEHGGADLPSPYQDQGMDGGDASHSDRSAMSDQRDATQSEGVAVQHGESGQIGRPDVQPVAGGASGDRHQQSSGRRPEFKEPRDRSRRIRAKSAAKPVRAQANIQDLLKEGQEVIVQVAKDPISTKGARLTCHISLPGRHLVCMPTIDHVGVSRRIERDEERRKLREYVERYRPKKLGFIVRTASGKNQSEKRIKQDIDYLTRLWSEIREKAGQVTAPALVYEDLNSVLRAIRDWVTEDIDKIVVDSRYHFNDMQRFASHFMPSLKPKIELYQGDVPIFDAYSISTELARGLERKVWLKSGGYLVVDQAEALVAIDVNTGRFVGKKNLEDTILKTNLEAVQEIAYQLRLRNCGGIIILDLIDMEREENKQRVYRALEEALKKDRARPSILKISELGLVEMTRKRTRDTMVRALCEACSLCEGKGFIKSKQTVAYEVLRELERVGIERDTARVLVQAHPDVIDILAIEERDTVDQLERRYRKQIYLQAVIDYHVERFEVSGDKREKGERGYETLGDAGSSHGRRDDRSDRGDRGDRDRGGRDRDRGRGRNRDRGRGRDRGGHANVRPVDGSSVAVTPIGFTTGAPEGELPQPQRRGPGDEGYSEEDRLAFLRAQAAQDAALARMGGNSQQPQHSQQRGGHSRNGHHSGGRGQQNRQPHAQPVQAGGGAGAAGSAGSEDDGMGLGRAPIEGGGHGGGDNDRRRGRRGRRGGRHRRGGRGASGGEGQGFQSRGPGGGTEGGGDTGGGSAGGGDAGGGGASGGDAGGGGGDHSTPPTT